MHEHPPTAPRSPGYLPAAKQLRGTWPAGIRLTTTRQDKTKALSKTRHMAPFTMIGSSPRESAGLLLGLVATMASQLPSARSRANYAAPREVHCCRMSCRQLLHLRSARGWSCWPIGGLEGSTTRKTALTQRLPHTPKMPLQQGDTSESNLLRRCRSSRCVVDQMRQFAGACKFDVTPLG